MSTLLRDWPKITSNLLKTLRNLENTSSTTGKRELVKRYVEQVTDFKLMLQLALDPYIKFGVQRFPAGAGNVRGTNTWYDAKTFLEHASNRDSTGANLTKYLVDVAGNMDATGRELFKRVLLKDLRCGVGATLVNSVFPGMIPSFSCMLATPLEERHVAKLQAYQASGVRVFGQAKKNGDRAVTVCPGDTVVPEMLSRKGFMLHNYTAIANALHRLQTFCRKEGVVFDGEVIVGNFFGTRKVKKLAGNDVEGAVLHVFDAVDYAQWRRGETDVFFERVKMLKAISKHPYWGDSGVLVRVPTVELTDLSWDGLNAVRDKLIAAGEEGLIIRPDLPYDFSSSARANMYKHKRMDQLDCIIKQVLPGEAGKKMENVAAKLLVELPNGQDCEVGMGKGLSMESLAKVWRLRGQYVGLVAEVHYQDKTENESGEWKIQFPKWLGKVRRDKS